MVSLKTFEYHEPSTLEEASSLLSQLGPDALIFAGGTDIIPKIRYKRLAPKALVNIKRIPGLAGIEQNEHLSIGALTTFNDICSSGIVCKWYPHIIEVFSDIASHQVRNLATLGGNICNAAPSADSPPILMAYDSEVEIFNGKGTRTLPLENFFKGPGETDLIRGEILVGVNIPEPKSRTGYAYVKHTVRESLDIAIVGVAVSITLDHENMCSDARIIVGASAPTPLRVREAEEKLIGTVLTPLDMENAGEAASNEISPIDDVRGSADYRREMTIVNLKRAVEIARGRISRE